MLIALSAWTAVAASAQPLPFISTDPDVVCTTLDVIDGVALFEGDVVAGECRRLPSGAWLFEPSGGIGRALIGAAPQDPDEADRRGALRSSLALRWPDGVVPYVIAPSLSEAAAPDVWEDIQEAIRHWQDGTFVRLVPRSGESDYVRFRGATGTCSSAVGQIGGGQNINLDDGGACGFGATVHEIGHAMGFFHEQSRADRDTYVTVNLANVQPGREHNFNPYSAGTGLDVGPYDYGSVMHYSATAFTVNGLNTIDPDPVALAAFQAVYGSNVNIGTRSGLSVLDRASVEGVLEACYDGVATGAAHWVTTPWSSCSSSCPDPGRTRVVSCHDASGSCVGDGACAGIPKPAEEEACPGTLGANFESGLGSWDAVGRTDDFDWTVGIRETPSGSTGPGADHTLGEGEDGWYAFIEASSPRVAGEEAHLTSVPFTVPSVGAPRLRFWYHAAGNAIAAGALEVQAISDPCGSETVSSLWASDGLSLDEWRSASVDLSAHQGQQINLRFVGRVGAGFSSDIAIDDVALGFCDSAPDPTCASDYGKGTLLVKETVAGKEKFLAKMLRGPEAQQTDYGDPLAMGGTAYDVCVFDDAGALVGEIFVDRAGEECDGKDCWRSLGLPPPNGKGYRYKDKEFGADGAQLLKFLAGDEGRSQILVRGANNVGKGLLELQTGIAAALAGSTSARVEVHRDDDPMCFATVYDRVVKDTGALFKAVR